MRERNHANSSAKKRAPARSGLQTLSWVFSGLLHAIVIMAAMIVTVGDIPKIRLDVPVYELELFSMGEPNLSPGPATPAKEMPGPAETSPKPVDDPAKEVKMEDLLPRQKITPEVKPQPEPKPKPEVKPKPEPKPKPEVKPEPKPEAKPIPKENAKKETPKPVPPKQETKPKPVEKKAPKEDNLAKALKEARAEAGKSSVKPKPSSTSKGASSAAKEIAALRRQAGGARGGGGGGSGGASSALSVYAQIVEKLIKSNWRFPVALTKERLIAVIEVKISPDGKILSSRLVKSSGRPDLDSSALRAISDTDSLPAPPSRAISQIILNFNTQDTGR